MGGVSSLGSKVGEASNPSDLDSLARLGPVLFEAAGAELSRSVD